MENKDQNPTTTPTGQDNAQTPKTNTSGPMNESKLWDKVDAVFTAARNAFFEGNSTFLEVLDGLIATLRDMKENEVRPLGGLGTGKSKMKLEDQEQPENQTPANPNI
jgi:hypothetical protein